MRIVLTPEEVRAGDALADYASKNWGWYLFAGIASVLFGFVVMSFNFATLYGLAVFVGAFFVGLGIVEIIGALRAASLRWLHIIAGVLSIVAGVLAVAWPAITVLLLAIFIGWTLLFWGIADVVGSLLARHVSYWWLELIRGIVSVLLGVWALRHPGQALLAFVTVIGIWAVVRGTIEVIEAFEMKNARRRWEAVKAETTV